MKRAWLVLWWCVVATPALACGGPDRYDLYQPQTPVAQLTGAWLSPFDGYESTPRDDQRFLYPLRAAHPEQYKDLWAFSYGGPTSTEPSVDGFAAAVKQGNLAAMTAAARQVVKSELDRPSALPGDDDGLRLAVEYLEIADQLSGVPMPQVQAYFSGAAPTAPVLVKAQRVRGIAPADAAKLLQSDPRHPRRASLRLRMLQGAMQAGIPDGWDADEIRARLPKDDPLFGQIDAWLRDFPDHPLADYVRLYKLRLHYLHGDTKSAWKVVMAAYGQHPVRAAGEMQFLVRYLPPPDDILGPDVPGELAAALIREVSVDSAAWSQWWRFSEAKAGEPWAVPMQEILLSKLLDSPTLPDAFPVKAAAPTPTWATLRLAALTRADRLDEAWAQSALCTEGPVGPIRAQIELARGDFVGAVLEPGVDAASRDYLIRVLATDAHLAALKGKGDSTVQGEVRLAVASRKAAHDDWAGAAKVMGPEWKDVAKQAKTRKKRPLDWARYLRSRRGELFAGYADIIWYRSLWVGDEREVDWAKRSFEDWYALKSYAKHLEGATDAEVGKDPKAWRAVLAEADESYNKLLNYGNDDYFLWGKVIVDTDEAKVVRRAGKIIRAANR